MKKEKTEIMEGYEITDYTKKEILNMNIENAINLASYEENFYYNLDDACMLKLHKVFGDSIKNDFEYEENEGTERKLSNYIQAFITGIDFYKSNNEGKGYINEEELNKFTKYPIVKTEDEVLEEIAEIYGKEKEEERE